MAVVPTRSLHHHRLQLGILHGMPCRNLFQCGIPHAAGGQFAPPWSSLTGCKGISTPAPGAGPPCPSSLILSVQKAVPLIFSYSSIPQHLLRSSFYPFLNVITKASPALWMGWALASNGPILVPAESNCVQHEAASSHKGHDCSAPATKTGRGE